MPGQGSEGPGPRRPRPAQPGRRAALGLGRDLSTGPGLGTQTRCWCRSHPCDPHLTPADVQSAAPMATHVPTATPAASRPPVPLHLLPTHAPGVSSQARPGGTALRAPALPLTRTLLGTQAHTHHGSRDMTPFPRLPPRVSSSLKPAPRLEPPTARPPEAPQAPSPEGTRPAVTPDLSTVSEQLGRLAGSPGPSKEVPSPLGPPSMAGVGPRSAGRQASPSSHWHSGQPVTPCRPRPSPAA